MNRWRIYTPFVCRIVIEQTDENAMNPTLTVLTLSRRTISTLAITESMKPSDESTTWDSPLVSH